MSIEIRTDTCNQPAKVHSIKSQCLPLISSEQCCRAFSRILMSDKLMVKTLVDASCRGLFTSTRLSCVLFHSTSSSKISVIVSWYSSTASSTPLVCWSHWWRAPSMIAKTRAKPTKNDITKTSVTNNFLRTKHEGRSREYRFKVVAEQTEHSKVLSKTTEGQYSSARFEQAKVVYYVALGPNLFILNLPASRTKIHSLRSLPWIKSCPSRIQSERWDLHQDYPAI